MDRTPNLPGSANVGSGRPAGETSPDYSSAGRSRAVGLQGRDIRSSSSSTYPSQSGAQQFSAQTADAVPLARRQMSAPQPFQSDAPPSHYAEFSPHRLMRAPLDLTPSLSPQAHLLYLRAAREGPTNELLPLQLPAPAVESSDLSHQTESRHTAVAQQPQYQQLEELLFESSESSEDSPPQVAYRQPFHQNPVPPAAQAAAQAAARSAAAAQAQATAESPAQQYARIAEAQAGLSRVRSSGSQPAYGSSLSPHHSGAQGAAGASARVQSGAFPPTVQRLAWSAAGSRVADTESSGETDRSSSAKKPRKSTTLVKPVNLESMTRVERQRRIGMARARAKELGVADPPWVPPRRERRSPYDKPVNWEAMTPSQKRDAAFYTRKIAEANGEPIPGWAAATRKRPNK